MKLYELYQEIALARDIPDENLRSGDVAVLIDFAPNPFGGEEGAILEIFNAVGESIAVTAVPISAIEPLRPDQVPSVRSLAA